VGGPAGSITPYELIWSGPNCFSAMTDPPVHAHAVIMSARRVDPSAIRSSGRSTANGSSPTW
jgi:hypothetical protein